MMRRSGTIVGLAVVIVISVIGTMRSSSAHAGYTLETLKGRWSALEEWETAGQYHTSVGIYRFDGKGGCSLKYIVNDPSATGNQQWQETTCTYEVHADGRGELRGGVTPQDFVISGHGRTISYVFNAPGVVGKGEMRRM